jgi:hypothetical protein
LPKKVFKDILQRRISTVTEGQVGNFAYLGSIISKDGGSSEDVKSRIIKAQGVFSQLKKKSLE